MLNLTRTQAEMSAHLFYRDMLSPSPMLQCVWPALREISHLLSDWKRLAGVCVCVCVVRGIQRETHGEFYTKGVRHLPVNLKMHYAGMRGKRGAQRRKRYPSAVRSHDSYREKCHAQFGPVAHHRDHIGTHWLHELCIIFSWAGLGLGHIVACHIQWCDISSLCSAFAVQQKLRKCLLHLHQAVTN